MPLRSVGLALLAGVLLSCCFPVLLFGVCVGCWLCCGSALLLLYSCLGSLLCFLPPLSCFRGLWWLVSLQGSPGSCHVMLSCPCIPSPCFRGLGVCVDLLNRSKTCRVFWQQGAEVPMSFPLPTKLDDMWQGYKSGTPDLRTCKYLRQPLTW